MKDIYNYSKSKLSFGTARGLCGCVFLIEIMKHFNKVNTYFVYV